MTMMPLSALKLKLPGWLEWEKETCLSRGSQGGFFCIHEVFPPQSLFFLHSFNTWGDEPSLDLETTREKKNLNVEEENPLLLP